MTEPLRVINIGTAEQPNFGGSAMEMGRLRGIREALDAIRNARVRTGFEHEDCMTAIVALLPKGVEW